MKPTQEQVLQWAREAGGDDWGLFRDFMPEIESLATLAYEAGRKDENEACAKVCEAIDSRYKSPDDDSEKVAVQWCAEMIRVRGQE